MPRDPWDRRVKEAALQAGPATDEQHAQLEDVLAAGIEESWTAEREEEAA